jgi:GTP cyclohydrolase I
MQERLTQQIADAIAQGLATSGVAVLVEAYHSCMIMRGVEAEQAKTTTINLRGAFEDNPRLEQRFFQVLRNTPVNTAFSS